MTYTEFKNKWLGKSCEMGGSANAIDQCVDLANAWISEGYNEPMVFGTNAVDFPSKISSNFEFIKNTPEGIPSQGDLMIYKSPDGIGHIDIFDNGDNNIFYAFSQNWPIGAKCSMVKHIYIGTYQVMAEYTEEQKRILEFLAGKTEGDVREAFGALNDLPSIQKKLSDLEVKLSELDQKYNELNQNYVEKVKSEARWQKAIETANQKISEQELKISELEKKANDNWGLYDSKRIEFNNLKEELDKKISEAVENATNMTPWEHIKFGIKLLIKQNK
jgi:uncharacterized coiled-coil protein SlyX